MSTIYQKVVARMILERAWERKVIKETTTIHINGKNFYRPSPLRNEIKFRAFRKNQFLILKKKIHKVEH